MEEAGQHNYNHLCCTNGRTLKALISVLMTTIMMIMILMAITWSLMWTILLLQSFNTIGLHVVDNTCVCVYVCVFVCAATRVP